MADKDVTVTFAPPNTWDFDPPKLEMYEKGKITLKQANGSTWTFAGANIVDGQNEFDIEHDPGSGHKKLHLHDKFTRLHEWCYTVTVQHGGTQYTSPDPQIINSSPDVIAGPRGPVLIGLLIGLVAGVVGAIASRERWTGALVGGVLGALLGLAVGVVLRRR